MHIGEILHKIVEDAGLGAADTQERQQLRALAHEEIDRFVGVLESKLGYNQPAAVEAPAAAMFPDQTATAAAPAAVDTPVTPAA